MRQVSRERQRPPLDPGRPDISRGLVDIGTRVVPLAEAAEAHRRAESGSVEGRILLAP
jgi:NADPH2:quinone reductase